MRESTAHPLPSGGAPSHWRSTMGIVAPTSHHDQRCWTLLLTEVFFDLASPPLFQLFPVLRSSTGQQFILTFCPSCISSP
jgi:hypothetical protein